MYGLNVDTAAARLECTEDQLSPVPAAHNSTWSGRSFRSFTTERTPRTPSTDSQLSEDTREQVEQMASHMDERNEINEGKVCIVCGVSDASTKHCRHSGLQTMIRQKKTIKLLEKILATVFANLHITL